MKAHNHIYAIVFSVIQAEKYVYYVNEIHKLNNSAVFVLVPHKLIANSAYVLSW